jgi:hypothetical protein
LRPSRRPYRSILLVIVTILQCLVAGLPAGALGRANPAAAAPAAQFERIPLRIRPGRRIEVHLRASGLGLCVLQLKDRRSFSSAARLEGVSDVRWSWVVPANAMRSRWRVDVRCWQNSTADPDTSADTTPAHQSLTVLGGRHGSASIVDHRGIAVAISQARLTPADGGPKWTEIAQVIITGMGVALTLVGLWFVYRQLRTAAEQLKLTREQGLSERTARLVERYQSREFLEMEPRVRHGFLATKKPRGMIARIRVWEEVPSGDSKLSLPDLGMSHARTAPTLIDVQSVLNFHEEMGVLFNARRIDRLELVRHFATVIVNAFETSWWWIQWQRENRLTSASPGHPNDDEIETYAEWHRMVLEIIRIRPDLRPRRMGDEEVAIVCVPERNASPDAWERYGALSASLSRPLSELHALETALQKEPDGKTAPRWRRVICVSAWEDRADQQRLQRLAQMLGAVLISEDGPKRLERLANGR